MINASLPGKPDASVSRGRVKLLKAYDLKGLTEGKMNMLEMEQEFQGGLIGWA